MKSFLILAIFLFLRNTSRQVMVEAALPFKDQCVKWHNEYRIKHQVGPVTWSNTVARGAEQWAKYLAANNLFKHEPNTRDGENLYMSSHKPTEPCTTATKAFYGEVKYYDFNKPGFSLKTGHFTQVVWKNTKQIGAAYAMRRDGRFVVVIRYSPPGNYVGEKQFRSNVLPAKEGEGTTPADIGTPPPFRGGGLSQSSCFFVTKVFVIVAVTAIELIF